LDELRQKLKNMTKDMSAKEIRHFKVLLQDAYDTGYHECGVEQDLWLDD
jgi:hypothetical protein